MKKVGIVGCGRIGGPVIRALQEGDAGDWELRAVLGRQARTLGDLDTICDVDVFLAQSLDLVVDCATPEWLRQFGEAALAQANVWTVNATMLAENGVLQRLEQAARAADHQLRILSGAIAGLDGISTLAVDADMELHCQVDVAPSAEGRKVLFSGSARDAAKNFPDTVNVSVASALAGSGLDRTRVDVIQPAADEARKLGLHASSRFGELQLEMIPAVNPQQGIHTVAACIIAALRQEGQAIRTG